MRLTTWRKVTKGDDAFEWPIVDQIDYLVSGMSSPTSYVITIATVYENDVGILMKTLRWSISTWL